MGAYSILLRTTTTLKDGTHPVVIRVSFNGKNSFANIGKIRVTADDWNNELNRVVAGHKNAKFFNRLIDEKDNEAEDLFKDYEKGKDGLTPEKIVAQLCPKEKLVSVFDYVIDYVEDYKKKEKYKLAGNIESKFKALWCYHNGVKVFPVKQTSKEKYSPKSMLRKAGGRPLSFTDITDEYLKKFTIYLQVERGNSKRTIFNIENYIRTMFNNAITAKTISADIYPFKEHKISMPESQKIGLDENEVLALEKAIVTSKTNTWLDARNVWMFSFCFGGVRAADLLLLRWDDFKNGRLYYVMGKNNKPVSIEIPDRAQKILDYYEQFKEENNGFVFPALKDADITSAADLEVKISNAIRIYNKWLKKLAKAAGITKVVSLHIARHSFGNITGDKISVQLLQFIYRHTKLTTTIGYQSHWVNNDLVDSAVKMIVNF